MKFSGKFALESCFEPWKQTLHWSYFERNAAHIFNFAESILCPCLFQSLSLSMSNTLHKLAITNTKLVYDLYESIIYSIQVSFREATQTCTAMRICIRGAKAHRGLVHCNGEKRSVLVAHICSAHTVVTMTMQISNSKPTVYLTTLAQ